MSEPQIQYECNPSKKRGGDTETDAQKGERYVMIGVILEWYIYKPENTNDC